MVNDTDMVVPGMNAIVIASSTTSAVSVVFCLAIVVLVLALKLHKKLVYRLALYQVMSSGGYRGGGGGRWCPDPPLRPDDE